MNVPFVGGVNYATELISQLLSESQTKEILDSWTLRFGTKSQRF